MHTHLRTHNLVLTLPGCVVFLFLLWGLTLLSPQDAFAGSSELPQQLKGVQVRKSLGQTIASNTLFTDSSGKQRLIKTFFQDGKPVILTLNYFRCPMLCTLQLNGLIKAIRKLPKSMHTQFRIVTISFNAEETPDLAKKKRENYLKLLGLKGVEWHFLVGKKREILRLTKALGFSFRYVPKKKQFAHPSVIYILTSKAKVSQYLSGLTFNPRDLRFSLITASSGKIGTLMDQFVMSCFVYNVVDGKYTAFAFGFVRLGGVLTVCFLVIFLGVFWLQEWKRRRMEKTT